MLTNVTEYINHMGIKKLLLLFCILLLAIVLRFTGVNWDQNHHLHPDERFLTMVGIDLQLPKSFSEYLDPSQSLLNPVNIIDNAGNKKYAFYVYGTFPITINKLFAAFAHSDTYNGFTFTGRLLSAFMDLVVLILIFKTVKLLEKHTNLNESVKYFASFFYAIAVLPIQLSHFFAVDTFLNMFSFASWYFIVRYYFTKSYSTLLLSAIFFGFALAAKITAVFMLPLLFISIYLAHMHISVKSMLLFIRSVIPTKTTGIILVLSLFAFISIMYLTLRLANPYMFESASVLKPHISEQLIQNWKTLKSWERSDVWFPPSVQWYTKQPVIFAFYNIAKYGLGLPYFALSLFGVCIIFFTQKKHYLLVISTLWVLAFFLYQSVQFASSMRYFIILYPFFAIFAAIGFSYLRRTTPLILTIAVLILCLIWPVAFIAIYKKPHSRIQASIWIYQNIPDNSTITWELWDDPLPLSLPLYTGRNYNFQELPIFDYDTPEKWEKVNLLLKQTDYYILSSNRAWGSIPTAPHIYPVTSEFYKDLLSQKRGFRLVKKIASYPSLRYLGIPLDFPDSSSEEAFTVYDHPEVLIFKRTP